MPRLLLQVNHTDILKDGWRKKGSERKKDIQRERRKEREIEKERQRDRRKEREIEKERHIERKKERKGERYIPKV